MLQPPKYSNLTGTENLYWLAIRILVLESVVVWFAFLSTVSTRVQSSPLGPHSSVASQAVARRGPPFLVYGSPVDRIFPFRCSLGYMRRMLGLSKKSRII